MKVKLILLTLIFSIYSCKSTKPSIRTTKDPRVGNQIPKKTTNDVEKEGEEVVLRATTRVVVTNDMILEYIKKYNFIAKQNMKDFGIPASITLAQGILESGSGTGPLSVKANNHFGIKCHKEWTGKSVRYDDDAANECFRKYNHPNESYNDHSQFLISRPRYAGLFKLDFNDYKGWAKGLKDAGYATDPGYPQKLISLIERFGLNKFDEEAIKSGIKPKKTKEDNTEQVHVVTKGDTLYSISNKYNITIEELKKLNNIQGNSISLGQELIIK